MTDLKSAFANILDKDEEIVEAIKPNKFRAVVLTLITSLLGVVIFGGIFVALSFFATTSTGTDAGSSSLDPGEDPALVESSGPLPNFIPFIVLAIFVLIILGTVITTLVRYKKTIYCYTNKRIIFRTGFIGADFKTLEYKSVLGISVNVDFLDKFVKPNTGTIMFSSNALEGMMMMANRGRNQADAGFVFQHVDDAYNTYRRIKEYVDGMNENKAQ